MIKDVYDGEVISVRTAGGETNKFPIIVGLHLGLVLSSHLFALVIDE